jgi:hypothetical protein
MDAQFDINFQYRHIVVVPEALSFIEMVKKGIEIYNDRIKGRNNQKPLNSIMRKGLKSHGNTIVITNRGGFEQMKSWVTINGRKGAKANQNMIPVNYGAIITAKDTVMSTTNVATCGGKIHVQIEIGANREKKVIHLSGYQATNGVYTATQIIERNQTLRGLLGGPDNGTAGHEAYAGTDKIIKIIDSFCIGI